MSSSRDSTKSKIEKRPVLNIHVTLSLWAALFERGPRSCSKIDKSIVCYARNATMDADARVKSIGKLTHREDPALVQANALFPISTRSRPPVRIVTRLHVTPFSRLWRAGRCHPVVTLHLTFLQQRDSVDVMAETISVM